MPAQDDVSYSSGHPHERASLSSLPPSPPLLHRSAHACPPGTRIDNAYEESPVEDVESAAAYSYTRSFPGPPYNPRYAAAAHSYCPDPTAPAQHMPIQQRFPSGPQHYHYDNHGRPLGRYPDDRPLIHYVTNEWQHQPRARGYSSDYSEDEFGHYIHDKGGFVPQEVVNYLPSLRVPRRVQRWLLIYVLLLAVGWFGWLYWLVPSMDEEQRLDDAFAAAEKKGNKFGANVRPSFTDMVHVKTLPDHLIPGHGYGDRRLIIIGDIHGCKHELLSLLEKARFKKDTDHLIFTGDIIAKGPDSGGVVDLARDLNASCVRGNHEDRMLLAWQSIHSKMHPIPYEADADEANTTHGDREEGSGSRGDYKESVLAKQFGKEQIDYLQSCPVILRIPNAPGLQGGEMVVAHAGLVPGVEMDHQDPFQVMNMRTIDLVTRVPSELRIFDPWEKIWNHQQAHVHPPSQRVTVVYGHDSKRGLNIKKYSKGLDSGCVQGGKLSALILDSWGRERVVSVKCEERKKDKLSGAQHSG